MQTKETEMIDSPSNPKLILILREFAPTESTQRAPGCAKIGRRLLPELDPAVLEVGLHFVFAAGNLREWVRSRDRRAECV